MIDLMYFKTLQIYARSAIQISGFIWNIGADQCYNKAIEIPEDRMDLKYAAGN